MRPVHSTGITLIHRYNTDLSAHPKRPGRALASCRCLGSSPPYMDRVAVSGSNGKQITQKSQLTMGSFVL